MNLQAVDFKLEFQKCMAWFPDIAQKWFCTGSEFSNELQMNSVSSKSNAQLSKHCHIR